MNFVSVLIARDAHVATGHSGRQQTIAFIREQFWLINANAACAQSDCRLCKMSKIVWTNPMPEKMADLPADRITPDKPPFSFVGLDCFGTFFVNGRPQST